MPYEEDHSQGKDRPVLVIGREGGWLVALPLTSKDHDGDAAAGAPVGARVGRHRHRGVGPARPPSEVRVNRLVRVDPAGVRREGAVLPRDRYDAVVAAARAHAPLSRDRYDRTATQIGPVTAW